MKQEDAADAVALYRKLLSSSEDSSVVIVTVGPLANIKNLIESEADSISELSGRDLIHRKVREFVIMGGQFPKGEDEWNFNGNMPGVTKYVLAHLDVPVTFSGYEVGVDIKTGAVFNEIDPQTPLYVGFRHFSQFAPWMKEYYEGKILDNSTYDQTAVLYAVRGGVGTWWDRIEGGYCKPDSTGGNTWVEGPVTNHAYLKLRADREEMAGLIEAIMLGEF
jgi:inosine-uridine nucleoside N-ribohydrolase